MPPSSMSPPGAASGFALAQSDVDARNTSPPMVTGGTSRRQTGLRVEGYEGVSSFSFLVSSCDIDLLFMVSGFPFEVFRSLHLPPSTLHFIQARNPTPAATIAAKPPIARAQRAPACS